MCRRQDSWSFQPGHSLQCACQLAGGCAQEYTRLIADLSHYNGHGVNDGISESLCSLSYVSVEMAAQTVLQLGSGTHLAKVDIQNAYMNIPVHPDDQWLLDLSWRGGVFIDTVLPFGLCSAPKIFNAVVDALEWVVKKNRVKEIYHYLDDFLVVGAPECMQMACLPFLGGHSGLIFR